MLFLINLVGMSSLLYYTHYNLFQGLRDNIKWYMNHTLMNAIMVSMTTRDSIRLLNCQDYMDYYKDGAIENDAMGYVLPNQAQAITSKYGVVQKVGSVFKFVYNYTEMEGKHKGKSTYLKFAVHVITPKMESENAYMKNIADVLRARQERINQVSGNPSNLVIAASESAAKMFVGDKNHIYDISPDNFNMDYINAQQDNLYMEGDAESQMFKFKGLHGEGLGIQ